MSSPPAKKAPQGDDDSKPQAGEVVVRVEAAGVNPIHTCGLVRMVSAIRRYHLQHLARTPQVQNQLA